MSFSDLGLKTELLRGVHALGFEKPSPIQQSAIPVALSGRDVLARAMTGSGKTAAFLLPILQRLHGKPRGTTRALVVVPTRELADQVREHFEDLAAGTGLTAASIYGGVGMGAQETAFRRGLDVLVATPGRLLDHFRFPYARLAGLEVLVLDEADRMLDMGFLNDIRRVLRHLPRGLQTMLFSATLPEPIVALAREIQKDPANVAVGARPAPATGVTHTAFPVSGELKSALLVELVKRGDIKSVIAFTRTKHRANRLAEYLLKNGVQADRIHGNRSQSQRTAALGNFKAGRFPVLVATDIAARGIDVDALSHVVNFDVPNTPEDYVHRVGRTARAEATGEAFLFVSPEEESDLQAIERALGKRLPRQTVAGFDYAKRPQQKLEIPLHERLAAAGLRPRGSRPGPGRSSARPPRHGGRRGGGQSQGARPSSR